MGEELLLASKWDIGFDLVRYLWIGLFSSLPLWARCTVLALFGTTLVYGFFSWLRNRSSAAPEAEATAPGAEATAPGAEATALEAEATAPEAEETAPEATETVLEDETRVR